MKVLLFGVKALLHGLFSTPQKTVKAIQAIPHDNRIVVRYYTLRDGWFRTELRYNWWIDAPDFLKKWNPEDFEEFIMASFGFSNDKDPQFWDRWVNWPVNQQRIYVDKFISAHEPMIRRELEEHYEKYSKISNP